MDHLGTQSFREIGGMDSLINIVKKKSLVGNNDLLQEYEEQVKMYNELLLELYESCKV